MKTTFFVFAIFGLLGNLAHATGAMELVNTREFPLDAIEKITVNYRSDDITVVQSDSDMLVIKEYMSENNSRFFAGITQTGNEITVVQGRRPVFRIVSFFRSRVEVVIPASKKNVVIKSTSGKIEVTGGHSFATLVLENTSGRVSVDSLEAETVSMKTGSGTIDIDSVEASSISVENASGSISANSLKAGTLRMKNASGKISVNSLQAENADLACGSGEISAGTIVAGSVNAASTSGRIIVHSIDGDISAKTTSGSISITGVSGNIITESRSGSISCKIGENSGNVAITSTSGTVTIDLPSDLSFNFTSRTNSGSLRTPFADDLFSSLTDRNFVQGVIARGDVQKEQVERNIDIRTTSGSIRLRFV